MLRDRFKALAVYGFVCIATLSLLQGVSHARRSHHHHHVRSHKKESKSLSLASYPLPERNWIRSGMWTFGSTENDRYYHTFNCPVMRRTPATNLVGWTSAQEALADGYEPHPLCHALDPRKDTSPGARVKRFLNESKELHDQAEEYKAKGDFPMSSQLTTKAWIIYGDALMLYGDMEKKAGRIQNANNLYQQAATAYASSQTALSAPPAFGAPITQGGGGAGGPSGAPGGGPGGPAAGPGGPGGPAGAGPGGGPGARPGGAMGPGQMPRMPG